MNSKAVIGLGILLLGFVPGAALADHGRHRGGDDWGRHDYRGHRGSDYARVLRVEPLYERVRYREPVQQCWIEERRGGYRSDPVGAAIVGGAMGAVIGSHISRGDGRTAATLGGAVVGAALGSELARKDARQGYRDSGYGAVERCHTRHEVRYDERIVAYRVTYSYHGRRQVTRMAYDPGRYVQVAVNVHPLG